jgi:RecA-family ATPase
VSNYRFINGLDYLAMPRKQEPWIIEPLLSPGALLNIYGQPKAGKSLLTMGLAIAVSSGKELWLDKFPIRQHGPVLWLEADNSAYEWWNVIKLIAAEDNDISNIHFADREHIPYPFDLLDEEADHAGILQAMIEDFINEGWGQPVMVVIDTIREVHSGDEDKSFVTRNVLTALQAATYPAALVLVSHSRKGGGLQAMNGTEDSEGDVMNENRGSNAFVAKMQSVIRVTTNRQRTHGYFTAEGRSIGHERFRIKQEPPAYLWKPDADPAQELVITLRESNPEWSERAIAKEVAQILKLKEETARSIVRKTLKSNRQRTAAS